MKNPHRFQNSMIFLITTFLAMTVACNIDKRETATSNFDQYYLIEPASLLNSLAEGRNDAFTLIEREPEFPPPSQEPPVNWDQTAYFQIADALHQLVWNESLEDLNLARMDFSLGCNEINNGLQYGQFMFFKVVGTRENESRIEHGMEIDPSRNFVAAWETEYYPNLENWESIDLSKVKISADEALQIAEADGGKEQRIAAGNRCSISVGISRDTIVYDGWLVFYSPSVFLDKVDPVTGK